MELAALLVILVIVPEMLRNGVGDTLKALGVLALVVVGVPSAAVICWLMLAHGGVLDTVTASTAQQHNAASR
jgi:hypothetical protein